MYRLHETPHHIGRRTVENISTPFRAWVTNGTIAHVAIPCYYQEIRKPVPAIHHDIGWHHHVGWPNPRHPDHICQLAYEPHDCRYHKLHHGCLRCRHYLDASTIFPIHFNDDKERYESFYVGITRDGEAIEEDEGIAMFANVDEEEDWVIRLSIDANVEDAIDKPIVYRFTVYGYAAQYSTTKIDAITHQEVSRVFPERLDAIALGSVVVLPSLPVEVDHNYSV